MGLFSFINKVAVLSEHDSLTKELAKNKAKGLIDLEARGLLIAQRWRLPQTVDAFSRAALLSRNLGELVIGFLMFSKRIGEAKATAAALISDPFFNRHGCLYATAVPLTEFARKNMNRIWSQEQIDSGDAADAGFAAFYATLVSPIAVDAWLMLAELKQLGFCPKMDTRNHAKDGLLCVRKFLKEARSPESEFCALLAEGAAHLSRLGEQSQATHDQ